METKRTFVIAVITAMAFQAQLAFAKSAGDFNSDMQSLAGAACAGIGAEHSSEKNSCAGNTHAFLSDPNDPAPCTSYKQAKYAFDLIQTICTKNIDGKDWATIRKGCFDNAIAKWKDLGLHMSPNMLAASKCGSKIWHFSEASKQADQEQCMQVQLDLAKQDEYVAGWDQEQAVIKAVRNTGDLSGLVKDGVLTSDDSQCFAEVVAARKKMSITELLQGVVDTAQLFSCYSSLRGCPGTVQGGGSANDGR